MMTWEDLTEDERRFLAAWQAASDEAKRDAFALMVNHQRHGVIVRFDSAKAAEAETQDE